MVDDDAAAPPSKVAAREATLFRLGRGELAQVRTVRDGAGATIIVSRGDARAEICYDIATNTVAITGDDSRPVTVTVDGNRMQRS